MRFWDTSAIVPLLVREAASEAVLAAFEEDPRIVVWWGTEVECGSALARREREGVLDARGAGAALGRLEALAASWQQVEPGAPIRRVAMRLVRVHTLRAADALQLAAATAAADGDPAGLSIVTLDDRLALAAQREGFPTVTPGEAGDRGSL